MLRGCGTSRGRGCSNADTRGVYRKSRGVDAASSRISLQAMPGMFTALEGPDGNILAGFGDIGMFQMDGSIAR